MRELVLVQKMVVIDDQPVFRQVVKDIMAGHFEIVAWPETVEQVWEAMREHRPAAAIIDVNLGSRFGGRDGLQLARELTAAATNLRIILVSGFMESAYESAALTIPGAVFMEKAALTSAALQQTLETGVK